MVNLYILSGRENAKLYELLKYEYIKEDYLYLISDILEILPIDHKKISPDNINFNLGLLLIINKILLDNLLTMTINDKFNLLYLINNKLICNNINIKLWYIASLFNDLAPDKQHKYYDYFEAEIRIKKMLEKYIKYIYNNNSDKYNEVFFNIIVMFQEELSWFCSNNFKIEIIYETTPVLITTTL